MTHVKIRAAIVTASDTRTSADDLSGAVLREMLIELGAEVVEQIVVSDELSDLRKVFVSLADRVDINLLLTTGGTGLSPRDNTPEATRSVIESEVPGIPEAMRRESAGKSPMAMLSRGIAGVRGNCLIINLPGSTKAVRECFEVIRPALQHAVDQVSGETAHPA